MAIFKDGQDVNWTLRFDTPTLCDLEDILGINFLSGAGGIDLQKIKLRTFCKVMWLLCKDQAKKREVSEDEFNSKSLTPEVLPTIIEKILEALSEAFKTKTEDLITEQTKKDGESQEVPLGNGNEVIC